MAFNIKGSHIIAVVITAGIAGWLYTGSIVVGGNSSQDETATIAKREAKRSAQLFKVRYSIVRPEQWREKLIVRGQTKASAIVSVRAQVSGTLMERLVEKGDRVEKNQLVCRVDVGARTAHLARSQAQLAKALADHEANSKLVAKGIVSQNRLKTMRASLDVAKAAIVEAKLNLERSDIRANASGIVQDPIAEVGEMLDVGTACITLVQSDPIKFTGQISERDINKVKIGAQATIELVTKKTVTGNVRFISPSADASTRTFLTEIDIPNSDGNIRDGMTARAQIKLPFVEAYRISPSWITLSDEGEIGVRTVDDQSIVNFVEVNIVAQTNNGFWVGGLEPGARIITLGQEYVVKGEKVEAVADILNTAENLQ